jgi:hypothetical protein
VRAAAWLPRATDDPILKMRLALVAYSDDQLNTIFDRTAGRCHICGGRLTFAHYGESDKPRGWEVEHSNPRANGGTDRLNNLYPAHVPCNRSKGAGSTRAARAQHGRTRAPMSLEQQEEARIANMAGGGLLGLLGAGLLARAAAGLAFGPGGVLVCMLVGAFLGYNADPEG